MNDLNLSRRKFLSATAAAAVTAGGGRFVEEPIFNPKDTEMWIDRSQVSERTYRVFGVPLRTGSLVPGGENDPQAYRDVQLLKRLQSCGCRAIDEGDVPIPSYLPHHRIPPIRSWPGPRIAWDCVSERLISYLAEAGQVPLLIGCDCSVVVGTTQALAQVHRGDIHVLYVDGDFDDAEPVSGRCQSAAALAVWLLTHDSVFWNGPPLPSSQVTVIGWSRAAHSQHPGMGSVSLAEIRRTGPRQSGQQLLATIPASASILVHLDIDVFREQVMPAAYFPHPEGMEFAEGEELLRVLLQDSRVRLIEVSEYASLRDQDQTCINRLVDLLCTALKK